MLRTYVLSAIAFASRSSLPTALEWATELPYMGKKIHRCLFLWTGAVVWLTNPSQKTVGYILAFFSSSLINVHWSSFMVWEITVANPWDQSLRRRSLPNYKREENKNQTDKKIQSCKCLWFSLLLLEQLKSRLSWGLVQLIKKKKKSWKPWMRSHVRKWSPLSVWIHPKGKARWLGNSGPIAHAIIFIECTIQDGRLCANQLLT